MPAMSAPAPPDEITLSPIGVIESDFPDKFGVPRQPGLAPSARATLRLLPPYDDPLAVRGLEAFSHLWLTFRFHASPERWTPLVRPPRLGGNRKVGVFASRSTHRPNRLGLSLVELLAVELGDGVRLSLAGTDLVSGTPVLDIKPYLPWAEARPEARAGFAPEAPRRLAVRFGPEAEAALAARKDAASLRALISEVLAQDPRPAYRRGDAARTYGVRLRDVDVRFRALVDGGGAPLLEVVEIAAA
ncbi:MAG: tRNA (N6-threonylcarbamoyladenosine(37)-N6)-methyltransferase TrmO [Halomonas sp.]